MPKNQSPLSRDKSIDIILEENTKKLDKFISDSAKVAKDNDLKIKHIQDTLNRYVVTKSVDQPSSRGITPPETSSENTSNQDESKETSSENISETVNKALKGWTPPETSDDIEERKDRVSNKSVFKALSTSVAGLTKKTTSFLWNQEEAKRGWDTLNKSGFSAPILGKITNALIAGIGQSKLFSSPLGSFIKFLFSPAGILLMYTIGKLLKKHVWDPYVAPMLSFIKTQIKPIVEETLIFFKQKVMPFLTDTVIPFFTSLFPTYEEIKKSIYDVIDVFRNPTSLFEKIGAILNLTDTILAPITNLVKHVYNGILGIFAKITNKLGMQDTTIDLLQKQSEMIDSMHGEFKEKSRKELEESDLGKKYSAAIDVNTALDLNKKIKEGKKLSKEEIAITKSEGYISMWGEAGKNTADANKESFDAFLKAERSKTMQMNIKTGKYEKGAARSDEELVNMAKLSYENVGLNAAKKVLNELSTKTFSNEAEATKYMQQLLTNNEGLSKSADAQNMVLKQLVKMLTEQGLRTEKTQEELNKLSVKAFETKNTTNVMINNAKTDMRVEKSMITTPMY